MIDPGRWRRLAGREKRVLAALAVVLFVLAAWLTAGPLIREHERLQRELPRLREDLAWMKSHAAEIRALKETDRMTGEPVPARLTTAAVEDMLEQAGLRSRLTALHPEPERGILVRFDEVDFVSLAGLLYRLERQPGAQVSEARIIRLPDTPGMVSASLLLGGEPAP